MVIKNGDTVSVEYEGKFDSGEIFDSSSHGDHSHPLQFIVGEHHVIKGFEESVIGMNKDEEKNFSIDAENAYGEHHSELVRDFPRSEIPDSDKFKEGMVLGFSAPDGRQFPATITKVTKDKITFDLNHPLAGKKLNFWIKVIDIVKKK